MPRSRGSEMPQRQSPRGLQLRTSSSDSDSLHHRSITDRSPKVGERRSPRGAQSDNSVNQKKLGTRIADLESQLGQAQEELKILKEQLASAEAAKKEAQEQLEKKTPKPTAPKPVEIQDECPQTGVEESKEKESSIPCEGPDENLHETDVFEVPVERKAMEPEVETSQPIDQFHKTNPSSISSEPPDPQKPTFDGLPLKNDEINLMKAKLEEKEKELEALCKENENLKGQLNEATLELSAGRAKGEEMTSRLNQLGQELDAKRANELQLKEKLEAVERVKEALETEMKTMRVQTEQWRKAADAAAAVLAGGMDMNTNDRRISERCGSMDKHIGSIFEPSAGGYAGFVGSPCLGDDSDYGFGGGKRKGSGIRMFGDLWKKKGQK